MNYLCPICARPLSAQDKSLTCEQRHQFDLAKEGYVNLLPVQNKKSKNPGDNKEMMQARREFLDQGFYQSLSDTVNNIAQQALTAVNAPNILDLGCGEGYYTHRLAQAMATLNDANSAPQIAGLDISKSAIRYAAKRYKTISFCVASAYSTPFADASQDLVTRIYAPSQDAELARIIKTKGYLLTVTPAADHLFELKQKIYQTPEKHDMKIEDIARFELIEQQRLTDQITLTQAKDSKNLLEMTPLAWKMSDEQKAEIYAVDLTLTLDFNITLYKRTA
ncbi:23S rRNA (guanine(745)-N(1))-methyltransferase [Moritella viscosa]|uniref:Ribosomal RNA large subunit methyltransferase A n=1 Tax=Moritella viscosa TaxID=80854 RepID=A0A1L0DIJ2_9GAMM|nr:23S rRNA (guanine(745)-N(1))-methyltransferase [Moritella viscosa]SGY87951.1 Ribosomal RNA large subunit methyltransferase A [Moritella viscosa]SHO00031.1 Ribosomal RNA large subunit methyltransferase A [Moritella viscosa]SHO00039.1 Ribosomal RNA large subunit methyltransferase A [Moritella viscosa]SHO01392.1 Ribosomal RNA large subunit methyltransferase A [Moritella viscosa]SHO02991.1 Ribosomal RNA large subunit methyltransferase A [Moritella viscosa]